MASFALLLIALCLAPGEVSYRKLTAPEDARGFYASGGSSHQNKRVHLHVPASVVHQKPWKTVDDVRRGRLHLQRYKTISLVLDPQDVYYRKIRQRTGGQDQVCVKGFVRKDPFTGSGRCVIFVHKLKTAPPRTKNPAKSHD